MRDVTPELAAAIEASEQVAQPRVSIDWDGDGHGDGVTADTFDRILGSGWGYTDNDIRWLTVFGGGTGKAADFQVAAGTATQRVPATGAYRVAYPNDPTKTDVDVLVTDITCPAPSGAALEPANVYTRWDGTSTGLVLFRPQVNVGNTVTLLIFANNTTIGTLATVPSYTHAAATPFHIRCQSIGTTHRMRIWQGAVEPSTWHLSVTTALMPGAGWVAFRSGVAVSNTNTLPVTFGYGGIRIANAGATSIDDVTDKLSNLDIDRDYAGTLPDEVLVVEGIAAAQGSGTFTGGKTGDEALNVVRYFSRTNPASPLYSKTRANRSVRVDVEYQTSTGPQTAPRLSKGVLRNLPVDAGDRTADLEIVDLRDRLRTVVDLPVVHADVPPDSLGTPPRKPGLEATWIASYALFRAGLSVAAVPSVPRTCIYIPYHGSGVPFVSLEYVGAPIAMYTPEDTTDATRAERMRFDEGPFSLALARCPDGYVHKSTVFPASGFNAMFFGGGISIGRCDFRIKPRTAPTLSPATVAFTPYGGSIAQSVTFTVLASGQLRLTIVNGAVTRTVNGPTLPLDDEWHHIGVDWQDQFAPGRATFYIDSDTTDVAFTITPTTTGGSSTWAASMTFRDPVAELVVQTGGTEASPWTAYQYPAPAVLDRLNNRRLTGIAPGKTGEQAWQILDSLRAAEAGLLFVDPDGRPNLWCRNRLNSTDALNPVRTVTAKDHLFSLAYSDSRDMIRNVVQVPYSPITIGLGQQVWTLEKNTFIGALTSISFDVTFAPVIASGMTYTNPGQGLSHHGWINFTSNGSGLQLEFGSALPNVGIDVTITRTTATTATVTILNRYYQPVWLLKLGDDVGFELLGDTVDQGDDGTYTCRDTDSITRFGAEYPLDVDSSRWAQTLPFARGQAHGLLMLLRGEQVVYTDLQIPGDPRLEPFDRLRVVDPDGLVLDTEVTTEGISDSFPGVGYDMSIVARPARDQWILGGVGVGTPVGDTLAGYVDDDEGEDPDPPVGFLSAGADTAFAAGGTFNRTATEPDGASITAREWKIISGPTGEGTVVGTAAALSWVPGSSPLGTTDLRQPVIQEMCFEFTSTAENSTTDWTGKYDYIEDILDGRGYTGGLVGFTSATGDMLALVEYYLTIKPTSNPLAAYLDGLEACYAYGDTVDDAVYGVDGGGASDIAASELGGAFLTAWASAATGDALFRQAQRDQRRSGYWEPALAAALADGVGPLGLLIYYDTAVNHGIDPSLTYDGSFDWIRATTSGTKPINGGNQKTWLTNFKNTRSAVLTEWGDNPADGRIAAITSLLAPATPNYGLTGTVSWNMYGDPFSFNRPNPPADSTRGTYVLRYTATGTGGGTDDVTVTVT